jgi:hypothetical protein
VRSDSFHRQNVQRLGVLSCKRELYAVNFPPAHRSSTVRVILFYKRGCSVNKPYFYKPTLPAHRRVDCTCFAQLCLVNRDRSSDSSESLPGLTGGDWGGANEVPLSRTPIGSSWAAALGAASGSASGGESAARLDNGSEGVSPGVRGLSQGLRRRACCFSSCRLP